MKRLQRAASLSIILVLLLSLAVTEGKAQDIHYSQFYASPLNLNPALTGRMNGAWRVALIYRNQWTSIVSPYVTPSASFDMPFVLGNGDAIGGGVMLLNDRQNGGVLNNLTGMLSAAYHKGLGKNNRTQLSFGLQGGVVQKKIDRDEITFGDQYGPDLTVENESGENFDDNTKTYGDLNAGLLFNMLIGDKTTFYVGGTFFHIIPPKEEFLTSTADNEGNRLATRQLGHAGAEIDLTKKFSLYPGVLFMTQAQTGQFNFGNTFGFHFINETDKRASLFLGAWFRQTMTNSDAVIGLIGLEYQKFRLGFSYDYTLSDLQSGTDNQANAFEVSLIYIGMPRGIEADTYLFCPRF